MFHRNIKLALAASVLLLAIWQFVEGNIGNGLMLLLLAGIFVFLYFKNELILLAFFQIRKQNKAGAKHWLDKIRKPEQAITPRQQGYYNYLQAITFLDSDINKAEKFLKKAVKLGLHMDHDLAMAKLNLAGIASVKRRKTEAQHLLREVKKLDRHNMLKNQIAMVSKQLNRA